MSKTLIYALLTVALLVQYQEALPQTNSIASEDKASPGDEKLPNTFETSDKYKIFSFIVKEIYNYAYTANQKGKTMLEQIVKDVSIVKDQSERLQLHIELSSEWIKMVDKLDHESKHNILKMQEIYELFHDLKKIVRHFIRENPTVEDYLFEVLLKKYGVEKLQREYFPEERQILQGKIEEQIEVFITKLTDDEKQAEAKYIEIFEQYKGKDFDKILREMFKLTKV